MKGSLHTDELLGAGGEARHRPAHRAPPQPRLRARRADLQGGADHLRRRGEHRADARGQGRHRAERDRSRATRCASPRCGSRSCRRSRRSTRRSRRRSRRRRCARWPTAARSRAASSTARWRSTTRSARSRRRSRRSISPVAGRANVLIVPNLESGNMLAKSLAILAQADAAGIVLGAKVPIILTSRADSVMARLASCAVAVLRRPGAARRRRQGDRLGVASAMTDAILVLNAGSSSIKFSLFARRGADLALVAGGQVEGLGTAPRFVAKDAAGSQVGEKRWPAGRDARPRRRVRRTSSTGCGRTDGGDHRLAAVGHRVAHGGERLRGARARRRRHGRAAGDAGAARAAAPAPQPGARSARCSRARPSCRRWRASTPRCTAPSRASSRCSRCPRSSRTRACAATACTGCRTSTSRRCCREFDERAARGKTVVLHLGSGASMCALDGRPQHREHDGLHRRSTGCRWGRARARSIRASCST